MKKTLFLLFCVIALTAPFAVCSGERTHSPIVVNIPKPGVGIHRPEICLFSVAEINLDLGVVLVIANPEKSIKVTIVSDDFAEVQEYICNSFELIPLPSGNTFNGFLLFEQVDSD